MFNMIRKASSVGMSPINWAREAASQSILLNTKIKRLVDENRKNFVVLQGAFSFCKNYDEDYLRQVLASHGVVRISNLYDRSLVTEAREEITQLLDQHIFPEIRTSSLINGNAAGYSWQPGHMGANCYREMSDAYNSVVNFWPGDFQAFESGMIDIFAIEKLASRFKLNSLNKLLTLFRESKEAQIVKKLSRHKQQHSNIFINRGLETPRGPHVDSNDFSYKAFLYLSDVYDYSLGPYCYLPFSHKAHGVMSRERVINALKGNVSTDARSVAIKDLIPLFGNAGTLIISCQNGIHAAHPQEKGAERVSLVSNFY